MIAHASTEVMEPPRFVLFLETEDESRPGYWRFQLQSADGSTRFSAADTEPDVHGERLELLSVVRGLEALDQPSRVTLVTRSRYVREGIRRGIAQWRSRGWKWECFGQMTPVKDADLWRRIDHAMRFHDVQCLLRKKSDGSTARRNEHRPTSLREKSPEQRRWMSRVFSKLKKAA